MKIYTLTFILASIMSTFAGESPRTKEFFVKGNNTKYVEIDGNWVHEKCLKDSACVALKTLKSKRDCKDLPVSNHNPTSYLCWNSLKGEVIIGKDGTGNEVSFCLFKDGSSTTTDSLADICRR
jgi:hypothetical protein